MPASDPAGRVVAVSRSRGHSFSKRNQLSIRLIAGLGVEGDCHAGTTVKHRSRVRVDPTQPNLRQVHLIDERLFLDLQAQGFRVGPGDIGENVTTGGLDLLSLPRGTRLRLGGEALVELTGLRNPCVQLDRFASGLMQATLGRAADGSLVRKAGVMGIVVAGGDVSPGDVIEVETPPQPHEALQRV